MSLILITLFSLLSYFSGIRAVLRGKYKPNIYSRVIWFLLAANSLIGVVRLENSFGIIILSLIQTLGSLAILFGSLRYSIFKFGKVELTSTALLVVSLAIWFLADLPIVNVIISLIAHFIGGIPTFATVIKNPKSEDRMFWVYFALASAVALFTADRSGLEDYLFPLYFTLFNTAMILLSSRKLERS